MCETEITILSSLLSDKKKKLNMKVGKGTRETLNGQVYFLFGMFIKPKQKVEKNEIHKRNKGNLQIKWNFIDYLKHVL